MNIRVIRQRAAWNGGGIGKSAQGAAQLLCSASPGAMRVSFLALGGMARRATEPRAQHPPSCWFLALRLP